MNVSHGRALVLGWVGLGLGLGWAGLGWAAVVIICEVI